MHKIDGCPHCNRSCGEEQCRQKQFEARSRAPTIKSIGLNRGKPSSDYDLDKGLQFTMYSAILMQVKMILSALEIFE